MKNMVLSILEKDELYGRRLADYISRREGSPFNVRLFLQHPADAGKLKGSDLILEASALMDQYKDMRWEAPLLILDEGAGVRTADSIYKFQSAGVIYEAVLRSCMRSGREYAQLPQHEECELEIFFCTEKSEIMENRIRSWCEKQNERQKLLYIDLEPVPACPMDEASLGTLSDLIYYIKQYSEHAGSRVKALLSQDAYASIAPPRLSSEIEELSREEWEELLDVLKRESGCRILVLDYGCSLPEKTLLDSCRRIRIFSGAARRDELISQRFIQAMTVLGGNLYLDKIVREDGGS